MTDIEFKSGRVQGPSGVADDAGGSVVSLVDVRVEFCEVGNYGPVATDLARAILDEFDGQFGRFGEGRFGVSMRLDPARDGRFEVYVAGRLVFSKRATFRLPDPDEIFYHVGVALKNLQECLPGAV